MVNIFINKTEYFETWLRALKDRQGRNRLIRRIVAAENGNFGDCGPVGEGVSEMRMHFGPGYRIYFAQEGINIYLLLAGGDKDTQVDDIKRAKEIWKELRGVIQ